MSKSLHSRNNKIFLQKLRDLRESRNLRQADLAKLLGRSQGTVSNVERGETTLDVIELREWLDALDYRFMRFLKELDAELRRLESLRLRGGKTRPRAVNGTLNHLFHAGPAADKAVAAPPVKAKRARTRS